jgi:hypothetical protein
MLRRRVASCGANPTLDAGGNNVFPAVDKITLSGSTVSLTPILMGNATATDTISGQATTLNENDPDSFSVDSTGQLVLVDQGASEIVFIKNPGTPQQPRRGLRPGGAAGGARTVNRRESQACYGPRLRPAPVRCRP